MANLTNTTKHCQGSHCIEGLFFANTANDPLQNLGGLGDVAEICIRPARNDRGSFFQSKLCG